MQRFAESFCRRQGKLCNRKSVRNTLHIFNVHMHVIVPAQGPGEDIRMYAYSVRMEHSTEIALSFHPCQLFIEYPYRGIRDNSRAYFLLWEKYYSYSIRTPYILTILAYRDVINDFC